MLDNSESTLEEARHRLNTLAIDLCSVIRADDAARTFIGVGLGIFRMTFGDEYAAAYFRGLSEELLANVDQRLQ